MRCNINLDPDLWETIGQFAEKLHVSRSAFISMACAQRIQAEQILDSFPSLVKSVNALKSENNP